MRYVMRLLVPLPLLFTTLTGCANDPLSDPNSVESQVKVAADSCQAAYDKVGLLLNQCNPTTSDTLVQMKAMLDAAKSQITELQRQLMMGTTPTCEPPDPNVVWRCSQPTANPTPTDTRFVQLTAQQVTDFGYPAGDCYVGVQKLSKLGSNWFYGPVPATKINSPALLQWGIPYNFPTNMAYSSTKDWTCTRVP